MASPGRSPSCRRLLYVLACWAALAITLAGCAKSPELHATGHRDESVVLNITWVPDGSVVLRSPKLLPTQISDSRGQPVRSVQPATGIVITGGPTDRPTTIVIAATWSDELPADYWSMYVESDLWNKVRVGQRQLISRGESTGAAACMFQEDGITISIQGQQTSVDDVQHIATSLSIDVRQADDSAGSRP